MGEIISEITGAIVTIKVIGIGGGGNKVLLRMAQDRASELELIGINTDAGQLEELSQAGIKTLQIGERFTKGLGTGGDVSLGEAAALDDEEKIANVLRGADLVFITGCMGGGVGTGASPVVARIAKEMGILSVGVVTLPFMFEGNRKMKTADDGVFKLQADMDALIAIKNDNLLKLPENRKLSLKDSFKASDDVLRRAIFCITELILTTGVVNVDFADINTIFRQSASSDAILGLGYSDKGNAVEALRNAVESPLIERSVEGARGIIVNISGSDGLSLFEVNDATEFIYQTAHEDVNIIFGIVIDESLGEKVRATIVATDFVDSIVVKAPKLAEAKKQMDTIAIDIPDFMSGKPKSVPMFRLSSDMLDKKE